MKPISTPHNGALLPGLILLSQAIYIKQKCLPGCLSVTFGGEIAGETGRVDRKEGGNAEGGSSQMPGWTYFS